MLLDDEAFLSQLQQHLLMLSFWNILILQSEWCKVDEEQHIDAGTFFIIYIIIFLILGLINMPVYVRKLWLIW